jgi:hypothetical protein
VERWWWWRGGGGGGGGGGGLTHRVALKRSGQGGTRQQLVVDDGNVCDGCHLVRLPRRGPLHTDEGERRRLHMHAGRIPQTRT